MIYLILSDLLLVGSSRLGACIRIVATQGILLGLLPWLQQGQLTGHVLVLMAASVVTKGLIFPFLLARALREADVRREVEPLVGYLPSLLFGVLMLGGAFWFSARLPMPAGPRSGLVVPVALFTIATGLFLIVARKKAITQVLGYIVLENGIYIGGIVLVREAPFLVELGVLLDVFVAVFIMGILVFHISREFDHIDTDRLSSLRDAS